MDSDNQSGGPWRTVEAALPRELIPLKPATYGIPEGVPTRIAPAACGRAINEEDQAIILDGMPHGSDTSYVLKRRWVERSTDDLLVHRPVHGSVGDNHPLFSGFLLRSSNNQFFNG